jgi:hypothetical protein
MRNATKAPVARKRENERRDQFKIFGCAICRKSSFGFGNSAWPVAGGTCCNTCNEEVVAPARWEEWFKELDGSGWPWNRGA